MMELNQKFSKTSNYATLALVLIVAVLATAANTNPVAADPCSAQLYSPNISSQYYSYSNVAVSVQVSVYCSFSWSPLYAVGTAYDSTFNSNVGTANAVLNSFNGGTFNGQLDFSLPSSVQGHSVEISVSVYNGQNSYYNAPYSGQYYGGSLLATAGTSIFVNSYSPSYPYYNNYPTYNNNYPTYNNYPTAPGYQFFNYRPFNYYQGSFNYYGRTVSGSCRYAFHAWNNHYCIYR